MLPKSNRWLFVVLAILLVAAWTVRPLKVSAAQAATPPSNSCLSCHEDLYYLHDTGKWYCITEHKDRCVNCHEGDAIVLNKDASHLGLVAHPQKNNGEKCLECHPQDAEARLAKFASLGGYKTITETEPYIPPSVEASVLPIEPVMNRIAKNLPWAAGGVVLFGLWLALVLASPLKP
ncbi:MAG: hypothetical protein AUJ21_10815 [Anaerolineae bacterium CG1_02_58_13]|nr:MAG: hypothetical protein AUJ21_10815 [Anaerolineae bacterium CG1_02_58_13]